MSFFSECNIFVSADDVCNLSDTVLRLQKQLNILSSFCENYGMKVNTEKTKIIVFRHGGQLRHYEKWTYNNNPIEVVIFYKYLGVFFTTCLKWTKTCDAKASQGNKFMCVIKRFLSQNKQVSIKQSLLLFDVMVKPILLLWI